jgi:hypothetical protein
MLTQKYQKKKSYNMAELCTLLAVLLYFTCSLPALVAQKYKCWHKSTTTKKKLQYGGAVHASRCLGADLVRAWRAEEALQVQKYLLYWYKRANIARSLQSRRAVSPSLKGCGGTTGASICTCVLSLLALLVKKYKYWHKSSRIKCTKNACGWCFAAFG